MSINILDYSLHKRADTSCLFDRNTWTTNLEENLESLKNEIDVLVNMHHDANEYYEKQAKAFSVISIVLHSLLSIFQVTHHVMFEKEMLEDTADFKFDLVTQIFIHLLTFYVTMTNYLDSAKTAQEHKLSSVEFLQLKLHIESQLDLDRGTRYEPGQYYEWVTNTYTSRLHQAPSIPKRIWKRHSVQEPVVNTIRTSNDLLDYQMRRFENNDLIA